MRVCVCEEIYFKILVHGITVAEKSYNPPSAGWRPRRASGAA